MSRSHRGRKGDGWPKRRSPIEPVLTVPAVTVPATYPDVCAQGTRCGHVVCSIVWYCMENS